VIGIPRVSRVPRAERAAIPATFIHCTAVAISSLFARTCEAAGGSRRGV